MIIRPYGEIRPSGEKFGRLVFYLFGCLDSAVRTSLRNNPMKTTLVCVCVCVCVLRHLVLLAEKMVL